MIDARQVALVTSDLRLAHTLAEQLVLTDSIAVRVIDGVRDAAAAGSSPVSLWLVDDALGESSGRTLIATLRAAGVSAPMILLAGERESASQPCPEADDIIERPFRLHFLLMRVIAHLADREASRRPAILVGPYELRAAEKLLVDPDDATRIRLTEKEVAILEYLAEAPGPTSRDALLHEVWGYQDGVTSHTLETHVYRLRQKIEADPANAAILLNEDGGYRLAPPSGKS